MNRRRGDAFLRASCFLIFQICLISAFDSLDSVLLDKRQAKSHSPLSNYFNEHFLRKGESAKQSAYTINPIVRFGNLNSGIMQRQLRAQHMMDLLIRFDKRTGLQGVETPLIRFGKRASDPLASFSSTPHIRFGKRALQFSNTPHIRFGKRSNAFNDLSGSNESNVANFYASGELDDMGFNRYRRPNPVEEDTMLRFG